MPKHFLFLLMLASFASCSHESLSTPSQRFPFAYVQNDCGPTDGIATQFYFTANESSGDKFDEPFITIEIVDNLPKSAPQDYSIESQHTSILASRCIKPGQCVGATSGTLHLSKYAAGKSASGVYELHFKDGSIERASFDATWRAIQHLLCG